ncbi:MAG: hypothetical protein Q8873_02120 [Bacillota bacterium]|nr:hypothetical protein [Bacillota bacterium]
MLPVLPKAGKLKEKQINIFGGIDRRDVARENCFSSLAGVDNINGNMIETRSEYLTPKISDAVGSNNIFAIENDSGNVDIYHLGNGGFYKNGTLLPFIMLYNVSVSTTTFDLIDKDVTLNKSGTYIACNWAGNYADTKLIRYGNYIFAIPQMLFTDGTNTYRWNCGAGFYAPYATGAYSSNKLSLNIGDSVKTKIMKWYQVGDVVDLYVNGNYKDANFTIQSSDTGIFVIKCLNNDGGTYDYTKLNMSSSGNYIFIKHKNVPIFADSAAVYNRMWGVAGNRVYCSRLSHPFTFAESDGTSSDAWWADTESSQDFTAISSLNSRIVAFKPDSAYEIYGTVSPYSIKDVSRSLGCIDRNSLAEVNGVLFLLTQEGVSVYGGTKFINIDNEFKSQSTSAYAQSLGSKYYILIDGGVYKYDYYSGLWTSLIDYEFTNLIKMAGDIFGRKQDGSLIQLTGDKKNFLTYGDNYENQWEMESVTIGGEDFYTEEINRLELRFECISEGNISVAISRDGGEYETYASETVSIGWQIITVPISMKPCSNFRYKIYGKGKIHLRLVKYCYRKGGNANKYE